MKLLMKLLLSIAIAGTARAYTSMITNEATRMDPKNKMDDYNFRNDLPNGNVNPRKEEHRASLDTAAFTQKEIADDNPETHEQYTDNFFDLFTAIGADVHAGEFDNPTDTDAEHMTRVSRATTLQPSPTLGNATYVLNPKTGFCTDHYCSDPYQAGHKPCCTGCAAPPAGTHTPHFMYHHVEKTGGSSIECAWQNAAKHNLVSLLGHTPKAQYDVCEAQCVARQVRTATLITVRDPYTYWTSVYSYCWDCIFGTCLSMESIFVLADPKSGVKAPQKVHRDAQNRFLSPWRPLEGVPLATQQGVLVSFDAFMHYVAHSPLWNPSSRNVSAIEAAYPFLSTVGMTEADRIRIKCGDPCEYDEVMHTENFTAEWADLLHRYPGLPQVALPHVNDAKSDKTHPWGPPPNATYTPKLRALVNGMESWVFATFGYPMIN
jgi:hypothetical protein